MNTYKGEGTSWGKLNVIANQIWVSFFQIAISLLAYVATFSGQLYFGRGLLHAFSEELLRHNSYFFEEAISSEQLLFSLFSEQSLFCRNYFCQNSFFFRSKSSTEQAFLENRKFFTRAIFFGGTV